MAPVAVTYIIKYDYKASKCKQHLTFIVSVGGSEAKPILFLSLVIASIKWKQVSSFLFNLLDLKFK